jgi:hypothetical protein
MREYTHEINQHWVSEWFENAEPFEVGFGAIPMKDREGWFEIYNKNNEWVGNIGGEIAAKIISKTDK